jgi:hypothetical protein
MTRALAASCRRRISFRNGRAATLAQCSNLLTIRSLMKASTRPGTRAGAWRQRVALAPRSLR